MVVSLFWFTTNTLGDSPDGSVRDFGTSRTKMISIGSKSCPWGISEDSRTRVCVCVCVCVRMRAHRCTPDCKGQGFQVIPPIILWPTMPVIADSWGLALSV